MMKRQALSPLDNSILCNPMRMQPQDERHDGRPGRGGTIPSKQITVLLAEDNKIVRKAFRNLLENEADLKVVGEAQNGRQAVK